MIRTPLTRLTQTLDLSEHAWIAGGAARAIYEGGDLSTQDIDIFFRSTSDYKSFIRSLTVTGRYESTGYEGQHFRFNLKLDGITYDVNAIGFNYHENPEDTMVNFDFTCTQVALLSNGDLLYTPEFARDTKARKLEYIDFDRTFGQRLEFYKSQTPFNGISAKQATIDSCMSRIVKYQKKGFTSGPTVLAKLLELS